ncbi:MAG: helix-turn-helix domain-containing protein [Chloroflexota bacterium]|nr:helix-turn-helix domain-containing protein [Chloroflexota bacterium]
MLQSGPQERWGLLPGQRDMATDRSTDFGELLRHHRVAAGLTQEGLAERAGLSERAIRDLEQGVSRARRDTLQLLAEALRLSSDQRVTFEVVARTVSTVLTQARTDRPHNLPLSTTPFIGRQRELGAVGQLLARPDVRLLTLTGPGGIGKTRLALRVAAELLVDFSDGVYWVQLAPITDPHLVVSAIAQELGIRRQGSIHCLRA